MRLNKKGFSYVEVILVIAMLVALGATAVGGFSTLFNARASSAVSNLEAMMSQSKINSLSGDPNYLRVVIKNDPLDGKQAFFAELYHTVKEGGVTREVCYKEQKLGNTQLTFKVNYGSNSFVLDKDNTDKIIEIKFNEKTGAVKYAGVWTPENHPDTPEKIASKANSTPNIMYINVKFANEYTITLWKLTGEHNSESV